MVAVDPRASNRKGCAIKRERIYNKKTNSSRTKLKKMALFLLKHYEGKKGFITLTTTQSSTGRTDSELMASMGKLLRRERFFGTNYTCVCERQRNTSDLHFHILSNFDNVDSVDWKKMRAVVAKEFGAVNHPAILQFDWLTEKNSERLIANYMSKVAGYCAKESKDKYSKAEESAPYSSLFYCRTFSVSKSLRAEYRRVADDYEVKVNPQFLSEWSEETPMNKIHSNDFYSVYTSNEKTFEKAKEFKRWQAERDQSWSERCRAPRAGSEAPVREGKPEFCKEFKYFAQKGFQNLETNNGNSPAVSGEKKIKNKKYENCVFDSARRYCDSGDYDGESVLLGN